MGCLRILFILIILSEISGRIEDVLDRITGLTGWGVAAETDRHVLHTRRAGAQAYGLLPDLVHPDHPVRNIRAASTIEWLPVRFFGQDYRD